MIEAGIADPDSAEGARFCTGDRFSGGVPSQCPYPFCIVFTDPSALAAERKTYARLLYKYGVSVGDIALILAKTRATVRGYLKK